MLQESKCLLSSLTCSTSKISTEEFLKGCSLGEVLVPRHEGFLCLEGKSRRGNVFEGEEYFVKCLPVTKETQEEIAREIYFLSLFPRDHGIITAREAIYLYQEEGSFPVYVLILMDKALGKNLRLQNKEETLPLEGKLLAIKQTVKAIGKLHVQGIAHRDVKEENVVFCPDTERGTLIDLGGCSYEKDLNPVSYYGSPRYKAPEVKKKELLVQRWLKAHLAKEPPERVLQFKREMEECEIPGISSDVYSLGIMMHQLLTPSSHVYSEGLTKALLQKEPFEPDISLYASLGDLQKPLHSLVCSCLHPQSNKRPTYLSILSWIETVNN